MNAEELFGANLNLIDRVVAGVCRRSGLRNADAEDFASTVKVELIANDYAILRAYEGRASLESYLTIVVQRLLSRERARLWGRWRPSAEAERLGVAAVSLEKLLMRDEQPLDRAIPIVIAAHPSLSRADVTALASHLPARMPRPRLVALPDGEAHFAASERADTRVHEAELRRISERAAAMVREALERLPLEDRMLLRFRFGAGLSIADAARLLGVPQRPLYRRIEVLLRQLRDTLERAGVNAEHAGDMISAAASHGLDFGLHGKTESVRPTTELEEPR